MRRPTILLADDHAVFIDGLVRILNEQFDVVGAVADGPGFNPTARNVVAHTTTDASGQYRLSGAPGNYTVQANLEGAPFEGGGATPTAHAVTLAAYQPAWHGGILWDDDAHLTTAALASKRGLLRIWTDFTVTQQYYPVVNTAFWIMNRLWGHATLGYHIVNILLHAASAWLVAGILRRWSVPGATLAAVIFALHPVHVESVAWITELKNTLSGVCYLGAALMYLRYDESRDRRWYAAAAGLFVIALFSKTVTATLPAALLVVFWWQRGRIRWREDVVPLLPVVAVGVAGGLLTAWVERAQIGAEGPAFQFTVVERCLIAGRAFWFYLGKLLWPADLIFIYPRFAIDAGAAWQYLYPVGALAVVVSGALFVMFVLLLTRYFSAGGLP